MAPKYFITGATGGLGSGVLKQLLKHLPSSSVIASSRRADAAGEFQDKNIQFRHADYYDVEDMTRAFEGVDHLLFVSANTYDDEVRLRQHKNVVAAAKAAAVKHVWYTSLAYGGYTSNSKIAVQAAHYETERMLKDSGLVYTSVREGIYADSFPIFLNYYPTTKTVYIPGDGDVAYASRDDLGEATANLILKGGHENEIVLLTGPRSHTLRELAEAVNEATGKNMEIKSVAPEEYVDTLVKNDEKKKPASFFEMRLTWYAGMSNGDGATVSPTMQELLGREPEDGLECVKRLLREDPQYISHAKYGGKVD